MFKRFVKIVFLITLKIGIQKLVRMKSYIRFRNGKKEKVRSHYRRY